jgi:site-specific recombinase XerD
MLWTGRPAYWFRHHRFSSMYAQGANDSEVQLFKGAKDPSSVNAYKHMSKKMAKSILKTLRF